MKTNGTSSKKSFLFGKSVTLVSSLMPGPPKVWLRVIPSVPMVKLKDWSFQYSKIPSKTNKSIQEIEPLFRNNFYDTSGTQVHTSKMILFYIWFELKKLWTWFFVTWWKLLLGIIRNINIHRNVKDTSGTRNQKLKNDPLVS